MGNRKVLAVALTGLFLWGCNPPVEEKSESINVDNHPYVIEKEKPGKLDSYKGYIGDKKLYYGAAYYPEGWNLEGIDKDIEYMKKAHMNVMRMAEFSWSLFEPEEGKFEFQWLHEIIEKLKANGIDVILGTPTATPPGWMAEKYPEIFEMEADGQRKTHGARRLCDFSNEKYIELSNRIVEKMAQEFGKKEGVIGWQTDNEFHINADYTDHSKALWVKWLKKRYKTLDNLNKIWNLNLWSQTYSSFEMIPMPHDKVWHHPSLRMAWYRFNNENVIKYQDEQVALIRKYSDRPITHDGMPSQALNYEQLFENLDYVATNNYHSFEAYDRVFSNYDRLRGQNKGFHWLFETTANYSGGGKKGQTWFLHQPDGSFHSAIWMNHALGGQGSMFWLWRQHWAGHEMVHGSILSAWGKPAANFDDIAKFGADLEKTSDWQMNNPVAPAEIGIMWDHEAIQGFKIEQYANGISYYTDWTYRFYHSISDVYLHRDVVLPHANLDRYKILFVPMMPNVPSELRANLKKWVENGGTLFLGPMSGYRNEEYAAFTDYALGDFEPWMGINIESRIPIGTKIRPSEIPLMLNYDASLGLESNEASLWSEALSTKDGKVLATYKNGMHKGKGAIIENNVGQGKVIMFGTDPGKGTLSELFLKEAKAKDIETVAYGAPGVVVAPRKGTSEGVIINNITTERKRIGIKNAGTDLLTGKKFSKEIVLDPFQVLVLEYDK